MKQIRNNVFETNSSSTHSIAIPINIVNYGHRLYFYFGEYNWEWDDVDPVSYLYTAIYNYYPLNVANEKMTWIKDILDNHQIEYNTEAPKVDADGECYCCGHIDHVGELQDFLEAVLNDEYLLLNFLFGGLVFTGNDNSDDEERCFINRNEKYYSDWDSDKKYENPYYMEDCDNYNWYWKGN